MNLDKLPNKLSLNQIIDFTSLVKTNEKYTVFNPSIVHYKDDLYLCCFRVWSRYINDEKYIELTRNVYSNPNHPWRSSWGGKPEIDNSDLDGLIDITKFAMLKIEGKEGDYNISLVKEYSETFNDIIPKEIGELYVDGHGLVNVSGKQLQNLKNLYHLNDFKFWKWQDSRLVQTPVQGLYFIIGNVKTFADKKIYRKSQDDLFDVDIDNCNIDKAQKYSTSNKKSNGCYLLYISVLYVDPITLKLIKVHEPMILCPKFAARIEKNWSLYVHKKSKNHLDIEITYQIREKQKGVELFHLQYDLKENKFIDECKHLSLTPDKKTENYKYFSNTTEKDEKKKDKKYSFFNVIEDSFDHKLHVSASSPSISYNSDEFLAVGHVKFEYNYFLDKKWEGTPIQEYIKICKEKIINSHWGYIYLFFLYTIDKGTYYIRRVTDWFLPQPADVSLIFPVGLTNLGKDEDNFLISYGNYDTFAEAMFVNRKEIETSLIKVDKLPFINEMEISISGKEAIVKNFEEIKDIIINYPFFRFTTWKKGKINKIIIK